MNIRLLRGQVVVREDLGADTAHLSQIIIPELGTAEERQRARKWHRGVVLAKGAPMLTTKGVEVPHGFEVGDIVVFHWIHRERSWTREWVDGKFAAWIPQAAIDAVIGESLMLSGALPHAKTLAAAVPGNDGRVCFACRYDVFAHLIHTDRRNERWLCPTEVAT